MLTLFRCTFHSRVTAVARKKPRSFCQKCRWQVTPKHECTLDPTESEWADYAAIQAVWERIRNQLIRDLSGNIQPQSSQLVVPLWTDPGIKSGISVRELIPTNNIFFFFKAEAGHDWSNILPKCTQERKSHHHRSSCLSFFFCSLQAFDFTSLYCVVYPFLSVP